MVARDDIGEKLRGVEYAGGAGNLCQWGEVLDDESLAAIDEHEIRRLGSTPFEREGHVDAHCVFIDGHVQHVQPQSLQDGFGRQVSTPAHGEQEHRLARLCHRVVPCQPAVRPYREDQRRRT